MLVWLGAAGIDAFVEWSGFEAARRTDATDTLGRLQLICDWGPEQIQQRDRLAIRGLYCHPAGGWGVFYTISGPYDGPWTVTVLYTVALDQTGKDAATDEADRRRGLLRNQGSRP